MVLLAAVTIYGVYQFITGDSEWYGVFNPEWAQLANATTSTLAGMVVDGTLTESGDDLAFEVTDGGATVQVIPHVTDEIKSYVRRLADGSLQTFGAAPDEDRFTVEVRIEEEVWGRGVGRSKRPGSVGSATLRAATRRGDAGLRRRDVAEVTGLSFSRARAQESGAMFVENSLMISTETSSTTLSISALSSLSMPAKSPSMSTSFSLMSALKLFDISSVFLGMTPCQPNSGGIPTTSTG